MDGRRRRVRLAVALMAAWLGCGRARSSPREPVLTNAARSDASQTAPTPAVAAAPSEPGCPTGAATIKTERGARSICFDVSEVTVADYAACVARSTCTPPQPYDAAIRLDRYRAFCNWKHPEARERHPINCVSFDQAKAYCAARGARLPTDLEWTGAASNGGKTPYPWGSSQPDGTRTNGCGRECPPSVRRMTDRTDVVAQYSTSDGFGGTAPVGRFPRGDNRAGIHDLVGNVAEFVVPDIEPVSTGDLTAGGGFLTQNPRMMLARVHTRTAWSGATSPDLGFRCVSDLR